MHHQGLAACRGVARLPDPRRQVVAGGMAIQVVGAMHLLKVRHKRPGLIT
jgi:hypothetical protein